MGMAKEDDKRKNFWDDEVEEDDGKKSVKGAGPSAAAKDSVEIDQKIQEARVLMEQTHQLYQQFFGGIEKRTPVEKLKMLETKINELQRIGTNLTTAKFKIGQFIAQYTTMKELWERKLRDRERK